MGRDADDGGREPWFSARCIFCNESPGRPRMFEERVILVRADSEEQAIRLAEDEARAYVAGGGGWSYTGFLDLFHLFDASVGHGTEVFSLIRTSPLDVDDYLHAYYDTGSERRRRDEPDS